MDILSGGNKIRVILILRSLYTKYFIQKFKKKNGKKWITKIKIVFTTFQNKS